MPLPKPVPISRSESPTRAGCTTRAMPCQRPVVLPENVAPGRVEGGQAVAGDDQQLLDAAQRTRCVEQ